MKEAFHTSSIVGRRSGGSSRTPVLADFYIVQEPSTRRCRIVEEGPAPGIGVVIGGAGFGVRTEAESRMRTVTECQDVGTSGSGETVIEERERVRTTR